jgi:hypothetical protein
MTFFEKTPLEVRFEVFRHQCFPKHGGANRSIVISFMILFLKELPVWNGGIQLPISL